ncbi:MAG: hypothetical protein L0207_06125 [Chlamydiae bacterium]|nr:hypothetical protein [Chlamydiota bacterium]
MKFLRVDQFENQLRLSSANFYGVISSLEVDRKRAIKKIIEINKSSIEVRWSSSIEEALFHLQIRSLFASVQIAVVDGIEKLEEKAQNLINKWLVEKSEGNILIFGLTPSAEIGQWKNELVCLDFSLEKPWDRQKRMKDEILTMALAAKKSFSPEALDLFFEKVALNMDVIEQELLKLFSFLGEKRREIQPEDVQAITSEGKEFSLGKLAQNLVWEENSSFQELELSDVLAVVGLLRYQLEMGLKMCCLLEGGMEDLQQAFPQLSSKNTQKYRQVAQNKGKSFFKKGLVVLFDLEYQVKEGKVDPYLLFVRFCAILKQLENSGI